MNVASPKREGLDALGDFPISSAGNSKLLAALAQSGGDPVWRARKAVEARECIALAEMAPAGRLVIERIDLTAEVRVICRLGVAIARRNLAGNVHVATGCVIGLIYPQEAVLQHLTGMAAVEIIAPRLVFHPAVSPMPGMPQVMCLGDCPAMRAIEILLLVYAGLAFQNVNLAAFDSLGAMNAEALAYWQEHLNELPLTRKAFLEA